MLAAPCAGEEAALERMGYLLRGSPVRIVAPDEFLDPVTDCLILEPVTLLNTDTTLDRLTLQEWLRAGALPSYFLGVHCSARAACHASSCCRSHRKVHAACWLLLLVHKLCAAPIGLHICKKWEPHLLTAGCLGAAGNSFCPRTHTPLNDWICVRSNDDLRARITAWAEQCGIDLDALITAHYAKAGAA